MNKILPIGSVVKLNGAKKPVMIFGYLQRSGLAPDKVVDYVGVPYPEGNIGIQMQVGFQMEDIGEVLFVGYETQEFEPWKKILQTKAGFEEK